MFSFLVSFTSWSFAPGKEIYGFMLKLIFCLQTKKAHSKSNPKTLQWKFFVLVFIVLFFLAFFSSSSICFWISAIFLSFSKSELAISFLCMAPGGDGGDVTLIFVNYSKPFWLTNFSSFHSLNLMWNSFLRSILHFSTKLQISG